MERDQNERKKDWEDFSQELLVILNFWGNNKTFVGNWMCWERLRSAESSQDRAGTAGTGLM